MSDDPGSPSPSPAEKLPVSVPPLDSATSTQARQRKTSVEVFVGDEQDVIVIDTDRWLRLCVQVLAAEGVTGVAEMSLLFIDESTMASYNQQYMGKAVPTDVLSFPIDDEALPLGGRYPDGGGRGPGDFADEEDDDDIPRLLGDVLVCPTVAGANASEHVGPHHDGSLDDELALLVVHGILHLLSYDHHEDDEAEVMEQRERELLHQFHRPILTATEASASGGKGRTP